MMYRITHSRRELILVLFPSLLLACNTGGGDQEGNNNNGDPPPTTGTFFVESMTYDATEQDVELVAIFRPHEDYSPPKCSLPTSELRYRLHLAQDNPPQGIQPFEVALLEDAEFDDRAAQIMDSKEPGQLSWSMLLPGSHGKLFVPAFINGDCQLLNASESWMQLLPYCKTLWVAAYGQDTWTEPEDIRIVESVKLVLGSCAEEEFCGDFLCSDSESSQSCSQDCPRPPTCGNGRCEPGESGSCGEDCGCQVEECMEYCARHFSGISDYGYCADREGYYGHCTCVPLGEECTGSEPLCQDTWTQLTCHFEEGKQVLTGCPALCVEGGFSTGTCDASALEGCHCI